MMTTTANEALYLYYLAHAESPGQSQPADTDPAGRLFAHSHAGCTALVGIVRIDDFCGPEAERRLSDLKWVSERAFGHERVVECGFRHGPVFPARFGTLFSSLGALDRFIEQNRHTILEFLDLVHGQDEWGIKTLLDRPAAMKWLIAAIADSAAGAPPQSPGMRYLQERRAQAAAEKEMQVWLSRICESVASSLDRYATDRRQRKIIQEAELEVSGELVLNLAALVPHDRLAAFLALIENVNADHADQGLTFILNGPWPPYSFCPPLSMPP